MTEKGEGPHNENEIGAMTAKMTQVGDELPPETLGDGNIPQPAAPLRTGQDGEVEDVEKQIRRDVHDRIAKRGDVEVPPYVGGKEKSPFSHNEVNSRGETALERDARMKREITGDDILRPGWNEIKSRDADF